MIYSRAFIGDGDNNCTDAFQAFAESSGNFSYCAILNAHPITICENCVSWYIKLVNNFKVLFEVSLENTPSDGRWFKSVTYAVIPFIKTLNKRKFGSPNWQKLRKVCECPSRTPFSSIILFYYQRSCFVKGKRPKW